MKQETLEEVAFQRAVERRWHPNSLDTRRVGNEIIEAVKFGAKWRQEQILQFLYSEITERRDYSASKMCEKVVEFIKQNQKK